MKKILLILIILSAFAEVKAQYPGYTLINQRYNWLAGLFSAFGVPAGGNAAFQSGQARRAGALYYDSTGADSGLYVWTGLVWSNLSQGGVTTLYTGDAGLTSSRTLDLNNFSLQFAGNSNYFLYISPAANNETSILRAYNPTAGSNYGRVNLETTNLYAIASLRADFNASSKVAQIVAQSDVDSSSITYFAEKHYMNGLEPVTDTTSNDIVLADRGNGKLRSIRADQLSAFITSPTPTLQDVTTAGNSTTDEILLGISDQGGYKLQANGDVWLPNGRLSSAGSFFNVAAVDSLGLSSGGVQRVVVYNDGSVRLKNYVSGLITGTPVNSLSVDVNGKIIMTGAVSGFVPTTRNINTTSPITGGGDLSADRTIAINNAAADGSTKGAASFGANDFDASSGNITIDYTNGPAARSLNNLASVAIPTPLLPSGDNTVDFGSSSFGWKDGYIRRVLMKGATSGTAAIKSGPLAQVLQAETLDGTGNIPSVYDVYVRSDETLANSAADQDIFTNAAHNTFAVLANTTYEFDFKLDWTHGAVAHSIAFGMTPTTATITNISYNTNSWAIAVGTATASQVTTRIKVTTTTIVNISASNAVETLEGKGWFTVGATGGTITPQIKFSVDPTGTILTKAGSEFHIRVKGNNTYTESGPWQ